MKVLINKSYSSSPRFYHFIKYSMPIKEPTRKRRKLFDSLAMVNLNTQSKMFGNIDAMKITSANVLKAFR